MPKRAWSQERMIAVGGKRSRGGLPGLAKGMMTHCAHAEVLGGGHEGDG